MREWPSNPRQDSDFRLTTHVKGATFAGSSTSSGSETMTTAHAASCATPTSPGLVERLNSTWHERGLQAFMVVVLLHWAEHLTQAFQIYVLGWPVPQSRGFLGQFYPWLVSSEILHYGYALVMLA